MSEHHSSSLILLFSMSCWLKGDGCEMGICGFGNGEAQWYRKENTGIRDGKLIVTAKAEPYAGNIYTSAKVQIENPASCEDVEIPPQ